MSRPTEEVAVVPDLRHAIAFLTPFSRGQGPPTPGAMTYFPVVGATLGSVTGAIWWLARRVLAPLPAAVVVVGADAALTGALHLDGVADAADGLLAHVPQNGRLAIMSEPALGTFGTVALGLTLLARTAALSAIEPSPLLLASLWGCSRSLMVVGSRVLPYARDEGLATAFAARGEEADHVRSAGVAGIVTSAVIAYLSHGRRGLGALVAGCVAGVGVLYGGHRRLGGFTGDILGAAGVTCETVALIVVARR
jgi:adenosylcobinamide-GDP ribazoletransferase